MKHSDQLRALVASGQSASPELLTEVAERLDELLGETDRLTLCLHDASERLAVVVNGAASCLHVVTGEAPSGLYRVDACHDCG